MIFDLKLLIPLVASFFITLFVMPYWIKKTREIGLVWEDMNKFERKQVAGSGGIVVLLSFTIGVLFYIGYRVFLLNQENNFLVEIFALLTVILLLGGVGLIDDLFGWRKGGMKKRTRLILATISSIPLMVINAGKSEVIFPFLGMFDLGIIYPLILIPVGIVGATTTFNFLAGFNGEEAGQGILILTALGFVAYITESPWLAIILFTMVFTLIGFLIFNYFPARVFPGDSLTYSVGGLIAISAILGNFERIAIFFFIPYILETGLKLRGGLKKQSFGEPIPGGELQNKYNKFYSLNHVGIWFLKKIKLRVTEKRVVFFVWGIQIFFIVLGFLIFYRGLNGL
jgi:UDP-N-acetylglucosamine--dolichyl-phosphate N-acetylglucosaminephosphotransferase